MSLLFEGGFWSTWTLDFRWGAANGWFAAMGGLTSPKCSQGKVFSESCFERFFLKCPTRLWFRTEKLSIFTCCDSKFLHTDVFFSSHRLFFVGATKWVEEHHNFMGTGTVRSILDTQFSIFLVAFAISSLINSTKFSTNKNTAAWDLLGSFKF